MQELTDSIKTPNLRIMGNEEGEEVQAKGICNIFNKIITEFPKSRESYAHSGTGTLQDTKQT
jgi:archaeosine-15-forming tRNA-guanine transglycosylase